ncbi:MAG: hypothetical protein IAI50_06770 [Candidatus Eremiobacteraeota bacterium]|nr:hypothetical protein [Candidatus Eremiobacteraeota bacterium]
MIARFLRLGTLAFSFSLALASFGVPVLGADALSYDDPGMHYTAPAGWTRVERSPDADEATDGGPTAVFVYHQGHFDQRLIAIDIQPYDGTLDSFISHHESELHSHQDAALVDQKAKITLSNGMPAYDLRISSGTDALSFKRRYECLIYDGKRSIVVSYSGRQGDFGDDDVKAAFAPLYVVAFPRARP